MIRLTRAEIQRISQFVISSPEHQKLKFSKNINAFTENGVAMLSSILKSSRAIQVNIQIMRTFTKLRTIISSNRSLANRMSQLETKYDGQFKVVFDAIRRLIEPAKKTQRKIGF